MMLRLPDVLRRWPAVAQRFGRLDLHSPTAISGALLRAQLLAGGDPRREPVAVFFAFAETRAAFPGAWRLMSGLLAEAQARTNGLLLEPPGEALEQLCIAVLYRRVTFDDVARQFDEWLTPLR
jgi:hypothetical protein